MEVDQDDAILQTVAEGGPMDYSIWPDVLSRLVPRLEKIVRNDFPIPPLRQSSSSEPTPSASQQFQSQPEPASQSSDVTESFNTAVEVSSQTTNKENDPPTPVQGARTNTSLSLDSALPPQIQSLLASITQTMTTYFSTYPPHTVQRLSELILNPKQHYRTLPSYLHAIDRVVHVTSGANIYPLPAAIPDAQGAKILSNGISATDPSSITWGSSTQTQMSSSASLGSDESLGGALLTPIPWLKNQSAMGTNGNGNHQMEGEVKTESTETIDGPHGPGGIETVSISVNGVSSLVLTTSPDPNNGGGLRAEGGVTQGELLRQEQQAGVVPAAQLINAQRSEAGGEGEEEETPHARGPEEIGPEDMGPQASGSSTVLLSQGMQGIDVEAAVGRKAYADEDDQEASQESSSSGVKREAEVEGEEVERKRIKAEAEDDEMEGQHDHEDEEQLKHELEEVKKDEVKDEAVKSEDESKKNIMLVDADGKTKDEKKIGESGENIGADAIDTSTV